MYFSRFLGANQFTNGLCTLLFKPDIGICEFNSSRTENPFSCVLSESLQRKDSSVFNNQKFPSSSVDTNLFCSTLFFSGSLQYDLSNLSFSRIVSCRSCSDKADYPSGYACGISDSTSC